MTSASKVVAKEQRRKARRRQALDRFEAAVSDLVVAYINEAAAQRVGDGGSSDFARTVDRSHREDPVRVLAWELFGLQVTKETVHAAIRRVYGQFNRNSLSGTRLPAAESLVGRLWRGWLQSR